VNWVSPIRGNDTGTEARYSTGGERDRPAKPRDDVQAMLIERGALEGGSKWLKDLVDDGSEERFNKWTICIEEHLKFIEIDLIDTLSTEKGEN
jgi:hypothetical protein